LVVRKEKDSLPIEPIGIDNGSIEPHPQYGLKSTSQKKFDCQPHLAGPPLGDYWGWLSLVETNLGYHLWLA